MTPSLRIMSLALATVCSTACVTTYPIPSAPYPPGSLSRLAAEGPTKRSVVYTHSDRFRASRFVVSETSLAIQRDGESSIQVPLDEIQRVVFHDRGDGAAEGALVGLTAALIVGVVAGFSFEVSGDGGTPLSWGLLMSGVASVVTVPAGALAGVLIGHRRQYRFDVDVRRP